MLEAIIYLVFGAFFEDVFLDVVFDYVEVAQILAFEEEAGLEVVNAFILFVLVLNDEQLVKVNH